MVRRKKSKDALMIQLFLSATLFLVVGVLLSRSPLSLFRGSDSVAELQPPTPQTVWDKARVVIDFGDKKRIFEGPVVKGQNAADAVKRAALAGKLDLKWNEVGATPRLIGIGEFINGSKFWSAYLNGEKLAASLYETKVNPNDEILLVFK